MKKTELVVSLFTFLTAFAAVAADVWPDGTPIGPWFRETSPVDVVTPGVYRTGSLFFKPGVRLGRGAEQTAVFRSISSFA